MNSSERKKQLIAQGALYRTEVLAAKDALESGLHPDTLARNVVDQATQMAWSAVRNKIDIADGSLLQTVLPLAMSGASKLYKKIGLKRTLGMAAVASLVTGAAVVLTNSKRAGMQSEADADGLDSSTEFNDL